MIIGISIPGVTVLYVYLAPKPNSTLLITPIFTYSAYQDKCWYTNENNTTCTIVHYNSVVDSKQDRMDYGGNRLQQQLLCLKIDCITDVDLDKNPSIVNNYNRIVLMHNEYVTHNEYNAIMNHKNVFYVFPNSLYRFVDYNGTHITYDTETNNKQSFSTWGDVSEFDTCIPIIGYHIVNYSNGKGLSCYVYREIMYNPYLDSVILYG